TPRRRRGSTTRPSRNTPSRVRTRTSDTGMLATFAMAGRSRDSRLASSLPCSIGATRRATKPRMTGNRDFAEAVHASGITHVFFVPTIMLPAMADMEDMGVRRVVTHGEKAAAYMADAYARAARRPGLCLAQTIGSANLAAGLRDAFMACSPVIALTGGVDAATRYRHVYQEIEDFPMWESVTKANFHVDALERFPDLLRQAF